MKFKIVTDEDFFNKFRDMERQLRHISTYFQNEGTVVPYEEWLRYVADATSLKNNLNDLLEEGLQHFERDHSE